MTKNTIKFWVSFTFSFALVMLVIVGGCKLVEVLAPYYGTKSEMILAVMTVGVAGFETAKYLPGRMYAWVKKDD